MMDLGWSLFLVGKPKYLFPLKLLRLVTAISGYLTVIFNSQWMTLGYDECYQIGHWQKLTIEVKLENNFEVQQDKSWLKMNINC